MMTQEEIFNDYHKKIENYVWSKVNDKYLAEDLTSVIFLKIYEKMDTFDETKASVSTWIYTIANNTVIDYFRTRKVYEEVPEEISDLSEIDEEVLREEQLQELADALKKIPERERDMLVMKYYHNLTLKDIALKMGMSYANAKIVHGKALNHLREILEPSSDNVVSFDSLKKRS